ncbi:MAG TPA: DUF5714 domain-containing protein [Draconibacterium sp.]|nr:DUF5714 domain-containing protein [Draconibacterium sp.]
MRESVETLRCVYCKIPVVAKSSCSEDLIICDLCKSKHTWDLIDDYCLSSASVDPVEMAEVLMKSPGFQMHCPDHHYLVPAVLLASYSKKTRKTKKLEGWLKIARNRAEKVPGAFCGTHGSCGAAVGTGIFMSTVLGATPLSSIEWDLCNTIVGRSLLSMASYGGPRCCKRVTYLSLQEAGKFLRERLSVQFEISEKIECKFHIGNKEHCLKDKCPFYLNVN